MSREVHEESCPFTRFCENLDTPAESLYDLPHIGEPEASPAFKPPGLVALEQSLPHLMGDPLPRVGDHQAHVIAGRQTPSLNRNGLVRGHVANRNHQLSASGHRVAGVCGQVQENSFEFPRQPQDRHRGIFEVQRQGNVLAEGSPQNRLERSDDRGQIEGNGSRLVPATREVEHATEERTSPDGGPDNRVQVTHHGLRRRGVRRQLRGIQNQREETVHIMDDPGRNLTDGLHPCG